MPTLKEINAEANTNFRRTKELVEVLKELMSQEEEEVTDIFTVTYKDGAIFVCGPYDSSKFYRLSILSDNGNPIQDLNPEWGGWDPFEWSKTNRTLPDNPSPPAPPFKWQIQVENYLSRRWRNRRQYPSDYVSTIYEGIIVE